MWWLQESAEGAFHRCTDACAVVQGGHWVCSRTGHIIGPALFSVDTSADAGGQKRKRSLPAAVAANKFRDAAQNVLRKLLASDTRRSIEGGRAKRARESALRVAHKRLFARRPAGTLPNLGLALMDAWAAYEQQTDALDVDSTLTSDVEARTIAHATEFFCTHIQGPFEDVVESRPTFEALALACVYLMRDGIADILPKSNFLFVHLPNLSRLKQYGYKTNHFTGARLLIQSILDVNARGDQLGPTTPDADRARAKRPSF